MDVQQFYNVFHEPAMGGLTAMYFFFLGIGAGTMLVSVVAGLSGKDKYAPIERIGATLAPFLVMIGGLFLFIEMGQPLRAWRLITFFGITSAASWGVRLVTLFIILSLINLWLILQGKKKKWFTIVNGLFAVAVAFYSGFLLVQMKGHELWNSPMIPVLFFISAIVSGIALVLIIGVQKKVDEIVVGGLGKFLVGFILFELMLVFVELITLFNSGTQAVEIGKVLLIGSISPLFLWLYIIVGMVIPTLILWRVKKTQSQVIASVLILIGVLAMRFAVIFGGQYLPLS
jgi:formate-dependent nitrite reductase membrane component NrfD